MAVVTGQRWSPKPARVGFLDYVSGRGRADNGATFHLPAGPFGEGSCVLRGLGELLHGLPAGADRIYLVNVPANWWGLMAQQAPTAPWAIGKRGHHASDATPVLRFRHTLQERDLELRDAAEWFGACSSVDVARDAWELLGARFARTFDGAPILAGPSTTGRQMLDRAGALPEPLDDDTAALFRAGVQAGRVELCTAAKGARVRELTHYDARVSYGALAQRSLGVGPAVVDDVPELPTCTCGHRPGCCPGLRARLLVWATVPDWWEQVGVLGVEGKPARYPHEPGETFDAWADAAEVALALEYGWKLDVRQRVILTAGKPLDAWARKLERFWQSLTPATLPDVPAEVLEACRWAVRAVVLKTVGALAQRSYQRTRVYADASEIPDGTGTDYREAPGGGWVTVERVELGRASYPELTAQLWARGRVRLLDAPTAAAGTRAGALHVGGGAVVAMNTDALYLDGAPVWPDDGAWGRYRLKGRLGKARAWPANRSALLKLRDDAAAELTRAVVPA